VKAGLAVAECYFRLGLVRTFFGFPTVLYTGKFVRHVLSRKREIWICHILSLVPETSRVAGLHIARSKGCQEKRKVGEDIRGGDDSEQGEVTNPASCRTRVIHAPVALTPAKTLCHTLSCPVSDTLKVEFTKNRQEFS